MDVEATLTLFWQAGMAISIGFMVGFVLGVATAVYLIMRIRK